MKGKNTITNTKQKKKAITITTLKKEYEGNKIISNISLSINQGDIVAIFGPNGCGKSTLLNILSGIAEKTRGEIKFEEFDNKKFSYVFQNYRESLLPWKNNYENIAFPLKLRGVSEHEKKKKIGEMEEIFSFKGNLKLYPYQLSGGQQQILAFMRALVVEPKLLFIDEPFSALDYENNLLLRKHLQTYYKKYNPTILAITHDIEEAVHLANKIVVLSKKPSKVIEVIENNAPFPREVSFLNSKKFGEIKAKVLEVFLSGARE
ncbi:MAG: ABC transporter ATP-binding protein [Candidatus Diapherotrites archaeon]|nr:ABC transporter ATP-binding protein [Candidatus Diapherotrites archaeon]